MSFAIPVILNVIGIVLVVVLQLRAWKHGGVAYWIGTYLLEAAGFVTFFLMMGYYDTIAKKVREGIQLAESLPPYSKYEVVCLLFAVFFLGFLLISAVLGIGKLIINRQERGY